MSNVCVWPPHPQPVRCGTSFRYHWETSDHKYKLADRDDKIGVITAYCQGVNKCPDALNRV